MTLRICHLITDLEVGGAERTLVNLLTGIDRTRFASDVVSLIDPGPMAAPLVAAGIPVLGLGMQRGAPRLGGLATLVRHLRRTRPAVLQTWLYHSDLAGTLASFVARPARLAWNLRCTGVAATPDERTTRVVMRLLARLSGFPDAVLVNAEHGLRVHEAAGYHPRQWVVIPNGVDVARFRPRAADERVALRAKLGLPPSGPVVGLVGRMHPMKDVDTFLRAAAEVARANAATQFLLCGQGFTAEDAGLAARLESLGLRGRIRLLGRRADVEDIYPVLDVLALSSAYGEGFPNVLIEAMACGVPCAVTDVGDSRAIVGEVGVAVPVQDPAALAAGIGQLLAGDRESLRQRARARVLAEYTLQRMCERYQDFYAALAAGARV